MQARGKTSPASTGGSFATHRRGAPQIDLVDAPQPPAVFGFEEEYDALDVQQGIGRSFADPHALAV